VRGYLPNLLARGPSLQKEENNKMKIQQLLSPALGFLEQLPPESKWHIEGTGNRLALYRQVGPIRPEYLSSFLTEASSIAKSFLGLCGMAKSAAG
jgi:hypothetical protein